MSHFINQVMPLFLMLSFVAKIINSIDFFLVFFLILSGSILHKLQHKASCYSIQLPVLPHQEFVRLR